jgi:hypothetical protein
MRKEDGTVRYLDIPRKYIIEMICDWRGAGRAQGTNPKGDWRIVKDYYEKNYKTMQLSNVSRLLLIEEIYKHV